jgi:hypothetical protein
VKNEDIALIGESIYLIRIWEVEPYIF